MTVGNLVAQLISYPLGRGLAKILPDITIFGAQLSPGPFTVKEHVLVTIMATVGYSSAYATDIVAVQRVFYNQTWNFSCTFSSLFCLSSKVERIFAHLICNCEHSVRSMADGHVDTTYRLLHGRRHSSFPRDPSIYDLARQPGLLRAVQHTS